MSSTLPPINGRSRKCITKYQLAQTYPIKRCVETVLLFVLATLSFSDFFFAFIFKSRQVRNEARHCKKAVEEVCRTCDYGCSKRVFSCASTRSPSILTQGHSQPYH
eukprot:m.189680 g.189680  ORF g.189680 m.189680 type:complete len:106 (-) comp13631_c4_seq52:5734-6051(-)